MTYELIESDDPNFPGHLIVDTDTGEIVEAAEGVGDHVAWLARQHNYLKTLIKLCETKLIVIDKSILKKQEVSRAIYDDLVCAKRDRLVVDQGIAAIREEIDAAELTAIELREIVQAVAKFDLKAIPPWAEEMFRAHVTERRSKPWVETSIALREPKPVRAVEREAVRA